jgi:hypothetical protein
MSWKHKIRQNPISYHSGSQRIKFKYSLSPENSVHFTSFRNSMATATIFTGRDELVQKLNKANPNSGSVFISYIQCSKTAMREPQR